MKAYRGGDEKLHIFQRCKAGAGSLFITAGCTGSPYLLPRAVDKTNNAVKSRWNCIFST
jgi:hypothetical protein